MFISLGLFCKDTAIFIPYRFNRFVFVMEARLIMCKAKIVYINNTCALLGSYAALNDY